MSSNAAQQRADRIAAFRAELAALESGGIAVLDPELGQRIRAHHDATLAALNAQGEIDLTRGEARLSAGMRIASVLGAAALSAAWGFFVTAMWSSLGHPARLALVALPPLLLGFGTAWAARRERSGYVASIVATVAIIALGVNLSALGALYNLPDSRHWLLLVGSFALILAYGYGLLIPLLIGIGGIGGWLWSLSAIPQGIWWDGAFGRFEPLAVLGAAAILVPAFVRRGPAVFAVAWRASGAIALVLALLVLGEASGMSLIPGAPPRLMLGVYQLLGAAAFVALIWQGLRRDQIELVRSGMAGMALLLFLRAIDWFWEIMPKWLFFLLIGAIALGALLILRRLKLAERRVS